MDCMYDLHTVRCILLQRCDCALCVYYVVVVCVLWLYCIDVIVSCLIVTCCVLLVSVKLYRQLSFLF